jgi:N-acetylglutamate synthase
VLDPRWIERINGDPTWDVQRSHEPDEGWFDCAFDEPLDRRRVHEQIVRRAPRPREFVRAMVDGVVAGCGMSASGDGLTGIFCMATRERYRRRGIGLALVRELCAWAEARGDRHVFLQVMRENEAAKELYRKVGFARAYGYHYRVR